MVERPASAFRRPASARPRPAAVSQEQPPVPDPPNEKIETGWLFRTDGLLSVADVAAAGFANCAILDADRWRGGSLSEAEGIAVQDLCYTFGLPTTSSPEVIEDLVDGLQSAFCGRGVDLLIVFQNVDGTEEPDPALQGALGALVKRAEGVCGVVVVRVIDAINKAYERAEEADAQDLAGVSVVLEGYASQAICNEGSNGEAISYQVAPMFQ